MFVILDADFTLNPLYYVLGCVQHVYLKGFVVNCKENHKDFLVANQPPAVKQWN